MKLRKPHNMRKNSEPLAFALSMAAITGIVSWVTGDEMVGILAGVFGVIAWLIAVSMVCIYATNGGERP